MGDSEWKRDPDAAVVHAFLRGDGFANFADKSF
jgi:hypothetical protein